MQRYPELGSRLCCYSPAESTPPPAGLLPQVTKQQLPSSGTLTVTFVASHRASWEAQPLSEPEFDSMWRCLVDPRRLARTAAALEQTLTISFGGSGLGNNQAEGVAAGEPGSSSSTRSSKSARSGGVGGGVGVPIVTGRSWYDAGCSMAGSVAGAGGGSGASHVHAVTDGWKMQLLQVRQCLVSRCLYIMHQRLVRQPTAVRDNQTWHCGVYFCAELLDWVVLKLWRPKELRHHLPTPHTHDGALTLCLPACTRPLPSRCCTRTATSPLPRLPSWWRPSPTARTRWTRLSR